MATTSETVVASVKLSSALQRRIEILASARQQTTESVMNEAIEQFVEQREQRERFLKDGVAAWEDYRATGLHITGAEVDAWLDGLDKEEQAELPECHL